MPVGVLLEADAFRVEEEVGVIGLEIGVVAFSRSSIFLADGVLALLLVPLRGD